jgi:hypothetical protein
MQSTTAQQKQQQEGQQGAHAPQAETMSETSSGPRPLPRSSSTVCIASATPRSSGSFTFSRMALRPACAAVNLLS